MGGEKATGDLGIMGGSAKRKISSLPSVLVEKLDEAAKERLRQHLVQL